MHIASTEVSEDEAIKRVVAYSAQHFKTLQVFDGLGDRGYKDESPNEVTLADIGRLVIINANLRADNVSALLDVAASEALAAVPATAKLEDCEVGGKLWNDAARLYELFKSEGTKGIGKAKRSKLLHAKRPGLVFINDSKTGAAYKEVAKTGGYWQAAKRDIEQEAFVDLMTAVAKIRVEKLPGSPTLAPLSRLRILDIVSWNA